jgi:uncharacterized membrane protein HdeD (DUF308 family)
MMVDVLSRNWWVLALRGALAILFGIVLLLFPPLVIQTMVLFFGAYAFVDGIFAVWTAFQNRGKERWWVGLLEGILGIVAGIVVFLYPSFATITAVFFVLYIIAFWAITTGIMQIWSAIQLRKEIQGEFWLGLSGLLSVIFGIFLILAPGAGVLAVVTIIAAYSIIFGAMLLFLAFRVRGMGGQNQTGSQTRQPV